jgi:patatin-like phospholipase/acyl hydrolase
VTLHERLTSPGPKRILALDGGGIRGNISIGFLERLETVLRDRHGNPELRLCDYFDLIAGTSTGSLIATMLGGMGFDMQRTKEVYLTLAARAFSDRRFRLKYAMGLGQAEYNVKPLEDLLTELFGDRLLGDPEIPTGLCLVTKRADTGSTWPLLNHPDGKYFKQNRQIELRQAVRAAGAAPTIFDPADVEVGRGERATFIDGAISTANNPSLQAFLVATLNGFPFQWETGEDNLLLVSIGTGTWHRKKGAKEMLGYMGKDWATTIPDQLIEDTNWQNQLMLQYMSRTRTPWEIDGEVGGLEPDLLGGEPALTYLRYNAWLEEESLWHLSLHNLVPKLDSLKQMDVGENAELLYEIGHTAATVEDLEEDSKVRRYPITAEQFPDVFDLTG